MCVCVCVSSDTISFNRCYYRDSFHYSYVVDESQSHPVLVTFLHLLSLQKFTKVISQVFDAKTKAGPNTLTSGINSI